MLVINRTPNTLTNLTVELSTMGDLRLVERPQSHTIGPLDSRNIRANIKVITRSTRGRRHGAPHVTGEKKNLTGEKKTCYHARRVTGK